MFHKKIYRIKSLGDMNKDPFSCNKQKVFLSIRRDPNMIVQLRQEGVTYDMISFGRA